MPVNRDALSNILSLMSGVVLNLCFYILIFRGHPFEFGQGENRAVLAHVLIPDVAPPADADPALHAHLKGQDDPVSYTHLTLPTN